MQRKIAVYEGDFYSNSKVELLIIMAIFLPSGYFASTYLAFSQSVISDF